jgi:hypothetical protein
LPTSRRDSVLTDKPASAATLSSDCWRCCLISRSLGPIADRTSPTEVPALAFVSPSMVSSIPESPFVLRFLQERWESMSC